MILRSIQHLPVPSQHDPSQHSAFTFLATGVPVVESHDLLSCFMFRFSAFSEIHRLRAKKKRKPCWSQLFFITGHTSVLDSERHWIFDCRATVSFQHVARKKNYSLLFPFFLPL
jgi:hypothetical protein